MHRIFSTADVYPRDRFSYWHDVACRAIIRHEARPLHRPTFSAVLEAASVAEIDLLRITTSAMHVSRTPHDFGKAPGDELLLCLQLAGKVTYEQEGREVRLEEKDFCLLDPLRPCSGEFSESSKLLLLKIRRPLIEARVGKVGAMTARSLGRDASVGVLTSGFMTMLPRHAVEIEHTIQGVIQEKMLDLIAMSLTAATSSSELNLSSARSVALVKLRAAIEARLRDPALRPASAAAAAGISVRYANALLMQDGTSLSRLIQLRRLERCRKSLEDRSQAHRTISDIAFGWGFSDMTHFSRCFKRHFGVTPREWRSEPQAAMRVFKRAGQCTKLR